MPAYVRLQDLHSVSALTTQRIEEAVDIGPYKTLTVSVQKPVAGSGTCTLILQHAATLEEDAFVDLAQPAFNLGNTTTEVAEIANLLRYIRWKVSAFGTGSASFLIDVIARET